LWTKRIASRIGRAQLAPGGFAAEEIPVDVTATPVENNLIELYNLITAQAWTVGYRGRFSEEVRHSRQAEIAQEIPISCARCLAT